MQPDTQPQFFVKGSEVVVLDPKGFVFFFVQKMTHVSGVASKPAPQTGTQREIFSESYED